MTWFAKPYRSLKPFHFPTRQPISTTITTSSIMSTNDQLDNYFAQLRKERDYEIEGLHPDLDEVSSASLRIRALTTSQNAEGFLPLRDKQRKLVKKSRIWLRKITAAKLNIVAANDRYNHQKQLDWKVRLLLHRSAVTLQCDTLPTLFCTSS